ncbi:sialidase family protein [Thermobaculum terrenum]|nr:hypothetical protein [Thermobaculum terrenum]
MKVNTRSKILTSQRIKFMLYIGITAILGAVVGLALGNLILARQQSSKQQVVATHHFAVDEPRVVAVSDTNVYFGFGGGLMISQDGGKNWGTLTSEIANIISICPLPDNSMYFATKKNIYFLDSSHNLRLIKPPASVSIEDIAASQDGRYIYIASSQGGIYVSSDEGNTWQKTGAPQGSEGGITSIAIAPQDSKQIYAGVASEIWESKDGGHSWQPISSPGGVVMDINLQPNSNILYAGTSVGLWKLTSSGWQKIPLTTSGLIISVAVGDPESNMLAVLDQQGNVYVSRDGGLSWQN